MRDGGEITKKGEKGAGKVGVKDRQREREKGWERLETDQSEVGE